MNTNYYHSIIKVQKIIRGFLTRIKFLPLILYNIRNYLSLCFFQFSSINDDGRVNSSCDEDNIIDFIQNIRYFTILREKNGVMNKNYSLSEFMS